MRLIIPASYVVSLRTRCMSCKKRDLLLLFIIIVNITFPIQEPVRRGSESTHSPPAFFHEFVGMILVVL